ncbi:MULTISPECIES: tail fiber assembly protein [Dickeya]|uniref:Tail fiber assembly protein n=1 Tax=Dickeya undicola TaxID=1577887 RepID=A0A3N0G076_9GAMM|nr:MULTISPECIES: tail fiber assembly protein [Dickeya]RNM05875.1 tail fiber assembly protein [Dickeya undicola]
MPYVSTENRAFYVDSDNLPADAIEISDELHRQLLAADLINWTTTPPSPEAFGAYTHDQLKAQAVEKRNTLIAVAQTEIQWRQYAVEAGIATDAEKSSLSAWKSYLVSLMRLDISTSAIDWPTEP